MAVTKIDFDDAKRISIDMLSLVDELKDVTTATGNISSLLNSMPANFKTTVGADIETLNTNFNSKIINLLTEAQGIFETQIANYYNNEFGSADSSASFSTTSILGKDIYFGYPAGTNKMVKVSKEELKDYLESHFSGSSNGTTFTFSNNGTQYSFNYHKGIISVNGETAKCDFYKTQNTKLGEIENATTIIGGSGEVYSGEYQMLNGNTKIQDNSLIIDVYNYNGKDKNPSRSDNIVAAGTIIGDNLANSTNTEKVYNGIIGFSQGGQAAARTISNHKGLYQSYVSVNSTSCWSGDVNQDLILKSGDGYKAFNDPNLNIIIARSAGDTEKFKVTQNTQISRLIESGVDPKSIIYLTNDSNILANNKQGISMVQLNNSSITGHGGGHEIVSGLMGYITGLKKTV